MDHDNDQWQWLWLNRYQVTVQCGFGQHCRSSHLAVGSSAADCWTAPSVRQQGMSANMTASKIKQQNTAKHSKINFWQWRLWQVTPNPKSPCDPVASTGTGSAAHSDWRLPQWTQSREATSPKQWNRRALKNTACQCLAVICQCHGVMTMTMIWQCVFQWWCCICLDVRRVLSPTAKQYPGWSHENNDQLKGWRAEQQTIRSAGCGTRHQTPESRRKSDRIQHKKNLVSRQWIIKEHFVKDKLI